MARSPRSVVPLWSEANHQDDVFQDMVAPKSPIAESFPFSTRILFLAFLVLGLPAVGQGQSWQKIWVTDRGDGLTGNLVQPSVVIDTNQALHVLFAESDGIDADGDPAPHNMTFRYRENVAGNFGAYVSLAHTPATLYSSLALDSASGLHAVFTSIGGGDRSCLRYAAGRSNDWKIDAPVTCGDAQTFPALAIDRNGTPHVVFESGGSIYYQHLDPNGAWSDPVDLSRNQGRDRTPTIAIAPDGSIHVLFYRWNSTTRRTLMYTTAPGNGAAFGTPQSLRIMSGTSVGLDLPFTAPPFVPSIAIDTRGIAHVVFTSIFGTNAELGQILYLNNAAGTWSDPVAITGIGFYNRASITVTSDGKLHVAAERRDPVDGDWDIVYTQRDGGVWGAEQDLTANDVDDFAPADGGRFIQSRNAGLAIVYQTLEKDPNSTSTEPGEEIAILTYGLSPQPALGTSSDEIDFGTIQPDECRDTIIVIANVGAGTITSTSKPLLEEGKAQFSLSGSDSFVLLPNKPDTIQIRFCPQDTGCFEDRVRISTSLGERVVRLHGCAEIDMTSRMIRLDTIAGHVGDLLRLTGKIIPAPTAEEGIDSFRVDLAFDHRALFFHRIVEGEGVTIQWIGPDSIGIVRQPGSPIVDSILFRIEVEGLVTGKPTNVVGIAKASLGGSQGKLDTENGLVYLEGCDIGSDLAFGKGVRIRSIIPFPVTGRSSILWQGPAGFSPTLHIVDPAGNVVRSETLPPGTGEEQRIPLKTEGLIPGWYIVELIDRTEHYAMPILIAE